MRHAILGILVLMCVSAVTAATPPTVILSGSAGTPIFVAASTMFLPNGVESNIAPEDWRVRERQNALVAKLRARDEASAFSMARATPALPCHGVIMDETTLEESVSRYTPGDSVLNARAIVSGTIKSVTSGFFYGTPGSLIELGDLHKIKADSSYARVSDTLYLRLPYAHFESGGVEFCRESTPGSYVPATGDRLLLFAYTAPVDVSGSLVYSTSNDVIATSSANGLHIPKMLAFFGDRATTLAGIESKVRAILATDRRVDHGRAQ
jgi:hypothetical protein